MKKSFLTLTIDHRFRIIEIGEQTIEIYRAMVDGDALKDSQVNQDIEAEKRDSVGKFMIIRSFDDSEDSEFIPIDDFEPNPEFTFRAEPATPYKPVIFPDEFFGKEIIASTHKYGPSKRYDDDMAYDAVRLYLQEMRKKFIGTPMSHVFRDIIVPTFPDITKSVLYSRVCKYKIHFDKLVTEHTGSNRGDKVVCDSPFINDSDKPCRRCAMGRPHSPGALNRFICPHYPQINYLNNPL